MVADFSLKTVVDCRRFLKDGGTNILWVEHKQRGSTTAFDKPTRQGENGKNLNGSIEASTKMLGQ